MTNWSVTLSVTTLADGEQAVTRQMPFTAADSQATSVINHALAKAFADAAAAGTKVVGITITEPTEY